MRMRRALLLPLMLVFFGCDAAAPAAEGAGGPPIVPTGGDGGVECARPEEGCACDPGQPPIDCYLDPSDAGDGAFTCHAGTRYCRDGLWTGCESIRDYTIVPSPTALIDAVSSCNPCDPRCFVTRDSPEPGDLTTDNSSGVSYDATAGGVTLTSSTPPTTLTDTDGDGVPDVADECPGAGFFRLADGTCATGTTIYHTLPYGTSAIDPLLLSTQIRTADVYFLMDTTGSMGGELSRLQTDLTSGTFVTGCSGGIVGAIRCTIPDAWFGVGYFDDYPVSPYGGSSDQVYRNVLSIQESLPTTQTAINGLRIHWGNDGPESNTQALWAVATGGGLSSYLSAAPACASGRWGYPCFRAGTIPIVVHVTDAPFHNGPGNAYPYCVGGSWADAGVPADTAVSGNETLATAHFVDLSETWVSFSGSTRDMVDDVAPGCGSGSRDAVFRIRLTSRQRVRFTTAGSGYDTVLGIRPVSGTTWTCDDDSGPGTTSQIDTTLNAGEYYVVVDGWNNSRGDYVLTMGWPYTCSGGYPGVSWRDGIAALTARNVRVITVQTCGDWSDSYCLEGETHARTLGNASGSLGSSGSPYVFRGASNGTGLSSTIVDAIVDLANYSRMDVSARAVGDTEGFVESIVAETWTTGSCTGISGNTFLQCLPGTDVRFRVTFHNDVVMPTTVPQVFSFYIELVGDGTAVLTTVPVRIVVPPVAASYPSSGSYWNDYDTTERCAIDERPIWGALRWTATVPAGTQIQFELRATDTSVDALPTATPVATVTVPSATSPVDIAATLRAAGYPNGRRYLRVAAVLRSDSTGTLSPTLTDMSVTYTCAPSE